MTEQGYWWKVNIKAIQNYGRRERGVKKRQWDDNWERKCRIKEIEKGRGV